MPVHAQAGSLCSRGNEREGVKIVKEFDRRPTITLPLVQGNKTGGEAMSKKKKEGTRKVCRDAGTGRFVTSDYAKKHPKTTVTETVKKPPKKR